MESLCLGICQAPVNGEAVASFAQQDGVWGSEMMSAAFACGKQGADQWVEVLVELQAGREGELQVVTGLLGPAHDSFTHISRLGLRAFAHAVSSVWHAGHCVLVNSCPPSSSFVLSRPPCCSAPQTCLL